MHVKARHCEKAKPTRQSSHYAYSVSADTLDCRATLAMTGAYHYLRRYFLFLLLLACTACATTRQPDHFSATNTGFDSLSGWQEEDHAEALRVFGMSCGVLARHPRPATSGSNLQVPGTVWKSLCEEAGTIGSTDRARAKQFFETRFVPFRVNDNGQTKGLFTGYYEPVLYGSRQEEGDFRYPIYIVPPELKKNGHYHTRAEIDQGAIAKRQLEIVYVDDPVMLFFMHIQGSGRVRMKDGHELRVGYAEKNGQPYVSLGKIMGDEGLLAKDDINFFTIRQWLYDHPDRAFALMQRNPSYIFFKELNGDGPVGAIGVALTRERSMAVDNAYIPYGLPVFLETELPSRSGGSDPFHRILIAQDTGGAIKGPVRGDIFFGNGADAEYLAGYMRGKGTYSLLVPKEIAYQVH